MHDEDDESVFTPVPSDPIETATRCLILLSEAVDTTEHYKARGYLLRMMESISIYTMPPKATLHTIHGGTSDPITH